MSTSLSIEKSDSHEFRSDEELSMADILLPYDPDNNSSDSDPQYVYPCSQMIKEEEKKKKKKKKKATKCNSDPQSCAKLPLDTVSPSRKKPTRAEPKESLEYMFGEKLNLGKDSRPLEKTKATVCKKVPEDFLSRSTEKVPMESPKLKPDEYLDYFPQHFDISFNGIKVYAEVIRPKKRKKPKATMKKDNMRFDEKREDLEDIWFRENEGMEKTSRIFADAALSYLREQGHNLELVKPGLYELGEVTYGYRAHFNFKAKRENDPSAPVEMYFGQLCYYGKTKIVVECCVSMGESDSLPYHPEDRGCQYCTEFVHHPLGGCKGIVWGLLTYSEKAGTLIIA